MPTGHGLGNAAQLIITMSRRIRITIRGDWPKERRNSPAKIDEGGSGCYSRGKAEEVYAGESLREGLSQARPDTVPMELM